MICTSVSLSIAAAFDSGEQDFAKSNNQSMLHFEPLI